MTESDLGLIHDEPIGVKWKLTCGFCASRALTSGSCGGEVVRDDVDVLAGVPGDGLA